MSARFRQSRDGVDRCNVHAVARLDREVYEGLLRVRRESGAKSLKAMLNGFLVDAIAKALESQSAEDEEGQEQESNQKGYDNV